MNNELNRLNSFGNWPPSAAVDPARIAKAGFFYTGQGTEVQCFSCGGKISDWNYGDQVMSRHRRLDRNCPFVSNPQSSGNVAQIQDPRCPQGNSTNNRLDNQNDQLELVHNYGVTEEDEMYKSDALRLLSFVNWDDSSVSREALVSAGFYHAGEGRLRCAWCGGELARMRRLGALGDPLEFHMRYFPGCAHAEMLRARDAASRAALAPPSAPAPAPLPPRPALTPAEPPPEAQVQTEGAIHNARVLNGSGTWRALGVVGGAGGARHPERSSLAARLETFEGWPSDRTQTPQDLAEAGFYFTGTEDGVRCFYCEGGLGKWESGDTPWREHARWFPHCGYLLLVKGREFVDRTRENFPMTRTHSADTGLSTRRLNSDRSSNHPVTDSQVAEQMESPVVAAALGAGLDFARIRNAIIRRLRATGIPFVSSEALIDSVLDSQLGEEPWSTVTDSTGREESQRLARDVLAESLLETYGVRATSPTSASPPAPADCAPAPALTPAPAPAPAALPTSSRRGGELHGRGEDGSQRSLEEENRQLKEARLCKVCMDGEVSVVFLPCGHLVSCAACAAGLRACPLCRAHVQALVRAYLA